jgi:hypothetical protein
MNGEEFRALRVDFQHSTADYFEFLRNHGSDTTSSQKQIM